jgi:hypothetical protein
MTLGYFCNKRVFIQSTILRNVWGVSYLSLVVLQRTCTMQIQTRQLNAYKRQYLLMANMNMNPKFPCFNVISIWFPKYTCRCKFHFVDVEYHHDGKIFLID